MSLILDTPNLPDSVSNDGYQPSSGEPLRVLSMQTSRVTISPRNGRGFFQQSFTVPAPNGWRHATTWVSNHNLKFTRVFRNPANPSDPNNGKRIYADHHFAHSFLAAGIQHEGDRFRITLYALLRDSNGDDEWEGSAGVTVQILG